MSAAEVETIVAGIKVLQSRTPFGYAGDPAAVDPAESKGQ
jgi:hypothetical protein